MMKLDFSGIDVNVKAEDLGKKAGKVMREGRQDVTITAVKYLGPSKLFPTWHQLQYTLKNAADQEIRYFARFPTGPLRDENDKYQNNLRDFLAWSNALGFDVHLDDVIEIEGKVTPRPNNIKYVMDKFYVNPEKQIGLGLTIVAGYRKHHSKFIGKENDQNVFTLVDKDDKVVALDAHGATLKFPDRQAIEAYAANRQLAYNDFCDVLKVLPPATPNNLSVFEPEVKKVIVVDVD